MRQVFGFVLFGSIVFPSIVLAQETSLKVVYPPQNHQTSADRIFFIGTAPSTGQVLINGKLITRSKNGHFAPSLPLNVGENIFSVRYQNQELAIKVTKKPSQPEIPQQLGFAEDSLFPAVDIARIPGETICFRATALANIKVTVKLASQTIALLPQPPQALLPDNKAALTGTNQAINPQSNQINYEGCTTLEADASNILTLLYGNNVISGAVVPNSTQEIDLGKPEFQFTFNGKTTTQVGSGKISIISPTQLQVAEVTAESGVARTGASTDYSRLTPLPKGTRAAITARDGDWLRLDYGAWINSKETRIIPGAVPPRTVIRSIGYRQLPNATEIIFPLQTPVPVSVQQGNKSFSLTLYNTTAQTDTFRTDDSPIISRLDWQQINPQQAQYTFNLKKSQQWGYKLRYEGTSLVLTLRHAPEGVTQQRRSLKGIKILLDPGHGGKESGAAGADGTLEKDVNLTISKLVRDNLLKRGATVVMTREDDRDVSLVERQVIIAKEEPAIALSIHHNALPDNGDAENTKGFGSFWYNTEAHSMAVFLHNYIVKKKLRPSYGVFWNNLALTRPASSPSVLLELGFMINPNEFEQIVDPKDQRKMAEAIANGIYEWFQQSNQ
ncbi:N-acetylmuramoyl-L-alanine amidase [Calothrix sp. PCC 6303]|uniref:N-acetylmuramoyl-L-alanine amidase n=1 Tax=Calothrix sp. PCC 6303 TaxID=1170562 RepID=UPI0002A05291|nr:N-acetylmuramoyl-L-alanine amidase [Calothrix sp. PCC 6303]AFZ02576.1 cell wall hydrolase/autolysin [Calothrix sp. PCC 6303]